MHPATIATEAFCRKTTLVTVATTIPIRRWATACANGLGGGAVPAASLMTVDSITSRPQLRWMRMLLFSGIGVQPRRWAVDADPAELVGRCPSPTGLDTGWQSVRMSYRVVQWATGNQGVEAIRAILDRPDMELVGAKVYSADKAGVDAGVLAGREPCGVVATLDVDEILALGAHCVAYFPRLASLDEVCRILASGTNVVT